MLRSLILALTRLPVGMVTLVDAIAGSLRPGWNGRIRGEAIEILLSRSLEIDHKGLSFHILAPNQLCTYRARSFSEKEPETLEWIDSFGENEIMWDIGANIGLYSLYGAKRNPSIQVFAFEPSVLNLELLARNIEMNDLGRSISIVPLPLFSEIRQDDFKLQRLDRGGALSAFSVDYGYDNRPLRSGMTYRTLGVSMDDMLSIFKLPQPNHIKMDVDGIEHLILRGGKNVLSDPRLKSVLVELNDDFVDQREMAGALLNSAGLQLIGKRRAEDAFDAAAGQVWNTVWVRP